MTEEKRLAEVVAVYPNKVRIEVDDLNAFKEAIDEQLAELRVGSYLEISDNNNCKLIAVIDNYSITVDENSTDKSKSRKYVIEASPLGTISNDIFTRGGDSLTIPPTNVRPAEHSDIEKIYQGSIDAEERFCFAKLSQKEAIEVPVNGNDFFNKHFAIVGSTGSGKSHTVAKILQEVINSKKGEYQGLNNSHIVLFDIHGEYKKAFPDANCIGIQNLVLPYWLLNSEELEELFLDTEANDHNQRDVFKEAVVTSKKKMYGGTEEEKKKLHYDSPTIFEIKHVLDLAKEKNEFKHPKNGVAGAGAQGPLFNKLANFITRLENKINDTRLEFIIGAKSRNVTLEDTIKQFIGYKRTDNSDNANITIFDLGGIPFEVLSITVSLISRILFEYGYFYKRLLDEDGKSCETPLLLIYEEAHKYVPKSELAKYRASRIAIERIAKEGRKYGVTLGIVSQRPSEISETIFSQCSSFLAMRLTNPDDQNYIKRLLPDATEGLTNLLPSMQAGEALLTGEAVIMPSVVKVGKCSPQPSSDDINYLDTWKEKWKDVGFEKIVERWKNK